MTITSGFPLARMRKDLEENVLNGHSHHYERIAPQNRDGGADPESGITQFVVGTRGKEPEGFWRTQRNSVVRNSKSYGVLKLELGERTYAWAFVAEDGHVLDSGTGQCHPKRQPVSPKEGTL